MGPAADRRHRARLVRRNPSQGESRHYQGTRHGPKSLDSIERPALRLDTTTSLKFEESRPGALREVSCFASCALRGQRPEIGCAEDAVATLEATLAAAESARSGRFVWIDE